MLELLKANDIVYIKKVPVSGGEIQIRAVGVVVDDEVLYGIENTHLLPDNVPLPIARKIKWVWTSNEWVSIGSRRGQLLRNRPRN
jgi:hypothetical protein